MSDEGAATKERDIAALLDRHEVASVERFVDRFLSYRLPVSVCADPVACNPGTPGRTGTNLLTADEARQMMEHVCGPALTWFSLVVKMWHAQRNEWGRVEAELRADIRRLEMEIEELNEREQ